MRPAPMDTTGPLAIGQEPAQRLQALPAQVDHVLAQPDVVGRAGRRRARQDPQPGRRARDRPLAAGTGRGRAVGPLRRELGLHRAFLSALRAWRFMTVINPFVYPTDVCSSPARRMSTPPR